MILRRVANVNAFELARAIAPGNDNAKNCRNAECSVVACNNQVEPSEVTVPKTEMTHHVKFAIRKEQVVCDIAGTRLQVEFVLKNTFWKYKLPEKKFLFLTRSSLEELHGFQTYLQTKRKSGRYRTDQVFSIQRRQWRELHFAISGSIDS